MSAAASATLLLGLAAAGCGMLLDDYRIDDSRLAQAVCELGDHRCSGDWLLSCTDTLQGFVRSQTCAAVDLCDADAGRCRVCHPYEVRCAGSRLETCSADGGEWQLSEDCGAPEQCNVKLAACAPCAPGEYQCNQGALSQCTAAGTWGAATQCASPELCTIGLARDTGAETGQCGASVNCMPGRYACVERRLSRCDSYGARWQTLETCASPELCSAALAAVPRPDALISCVRPTCSYETYRCDGAQLFKCAPTLDGWVPLKTCSDQPCNPDPKVHDCAPCAAGSFVCQGSDLLSCDASGVYKLAQHCAAPELCDATAGTCGAEECDTPGASVCDPYEPTLRTCGADHRWRQFNCSTTGLCSERNARCEQPVCERGSTRCERGMFQRCNTDLTAWETVVQCDNPGECDVTLEGCSPEPCAPDAYRCNDVFLEHCVDGAWQRSARCAAPGLCDADAKRCDQPMCEKGKFACRDQFLLRCGPLRTLDDYATCPTPSQCNADAGLCL